MDDEPRTEEERLEELRQSGEAIARLAADSEAFAEAVAAFRAADAERFQAVLARPDLLERCRLICRWLCSKHCIFVCLKLAGPPEAMPELNVEEWRQVGILTGRIAADDALLRQFVGAVEREDVDAWRELVKQVQAERFQHQLCHWLCLVRCRLVCRLLCPPPPQIIKVGYIPVSQITASGYAAGPSNPPPFTPPDNPAAGVGDHPFGSWVHVNGVFNVVGASQYKVEFATAAAGPWTPIATTLPDFDAAGNNYTRAPVMPDGWYDIAAMGYGSEGQTYLTDWLTPAAIDDLYYLRLVVRTAALTEFISAVVAVRLDNQAPRGPVLPGDRPRITISQGGRTLDCCETVQQDGGPLNINIEGTDENFSRLSVDLYGSCGFVAHIFDKSYNGNLADHGAPSPGIDIPFDPWTLQLERCCYVVWVRIYDRVIANNWSSGHGAENWQSLTIA